eukprot:scpid102089/ scgid30809/ 
MIPACTPQAASCLRNSDPPSAPNSFGLQFKLIAERSFKLQRIREVQPIIVVPIVHGPCGSEIPKLGEYAAPVLKARTALNKSSGLCFEFDAHVSLVLLQ